ncbi:MAG: OsmC family protein [Microscillaceae bacterium]
MPTSKIIYQGDLRTEAQHLASGQAILTDAPTDNQGKGEAFSPTDLVATALASCMLTMMGIYARREGIAMEGTRAEVEKIMAANPRRISEVKVDIYFPHDLHLSAAQKERLWQIAKTCPVRQSLHPDLVETLTMHFADAQLPL